MATLTYTYNLGATIANNSTQILDLNVFGLFGQAITDVSVTLTGLTHTFASDLDILLVAPNGINNLMFMSDVRSSDDLFDTTLTFSDSGTGILDINSASAPIDSGDFLPATFSDTETDANFGSATGGINHAGAGATFAGAFAGLSPEGVWELYVRDDAAGDTGTLASWSLSISILSDVVTLTGAAGNDFYSVAPSGATSGEFSVNGGDTVLYSGVSQFVISSGGGNDVIYGSAGGDNLTGGAGRDVLYGVGGNDDFIIFGGEAVAGEIYDGGSGTDTIYSSGAAFVNDLRAVTLRSIEQLVFNDPGVLQTGEVRLNAAQFGTGFSLTGTVDGFSFTDASDKLSVTMGTVSTLDLSGLTMQDFAAAGDRVVITGDGSAETITGTTAHDEIFGNGGNDILNGFSGADTLWGGDGNDRLVVSQSAAGETDNLDGGADTDTAVFSGLGVAIWVDLLYVGVEAQTRDTNNVTTGTWRNVADLTWIENVVGTAFSDQLLGSSSDNFFFYTGNVGNVFDVYNGRGGIDTADFSGFNRAIWVDLLFAGVEAQTRDTNNVTSGTWRTIADLTSIENLVDTAYSDQMLGTNSDNVFFYTGNVGNVFDSYNGRGGIDTVDFSGFNHAVWVDLSYAGVEAQTRDTQNVTSGTWRTIVDLTGFENVSGTAFADYLRGNSVANILDGGSGNDTLIGGLGLDIFKFTSSLAAPNMDTITDYSIADDSIQLDNAIFTLLTATGALAANLFKNLALGAQDADDVIIYDQTTGALFYDSNGLTAGGQTQFADLTNGLVMTESEFTVI